MVFRHLQVSFRLGMIIGTTKLYIFISVWVTLTFIQGQVYMRNKNFGVHFLINSAVDVREMIVKKLCVVNMDHLSIAVLVLVFVCYRCFVFIQNLRVAVESFQVVKVFTFRISEHFFKNCYSVGNVV